MDDFEKELKTGFLDEASQLLTDAEGCFLGLEKNPNDPETLEKIFRLAHNLKGGSRAVGFMGMADFTHDLESLILKVKKNELKATPETITVLLQSCDQLRLMIDTLKPDFDAVVDVTEVLGKIRSLLGTAPVASVPDAVKPVAAPKKPSQPVATTQEEDSIRLTVGKLDDIINQVGELLILNTTLTGYRKSVKSPEILRALDLFSKTIGVLQDKTLGLRMLSLKATFSKMNRIVRDTSQSLGKQVELVVSGENTELDKQMIERISDPLIHLVRNAVDHGIELPEERLAAGKQALGVIQLSAYQRKGQIIIEIKDDGRGMNAKKLVEKAIEKGVLPQGSALEDDQAYQLIFAPGFSTKQEVSGISGRGVGMDVVKKNIMELRGEVEISTIPGKGSSFRLVLPPTVSIIDVMIVEAQRQRYAIPTYHVDGFVSTSSYLDQAESGVPMTLKFEDESVSAQSLWSILGFETSKDKIAPIAVIFRNSRQPFSILVDNVVGQQSVVVKKLGLELGAVKGVTGAAILGDGEVALILDCYELLGQKNISDSDRKPNGSSETQI